MDQRGCGRSQPLGCLARNTLPELVADIEAVRRALGVPRWGMLLGGSWGVTLALAYAAQHPERVRSLLLRGVCLMRPEEVSWAFRSGGGAASLFPGSFEAFSAIADTADGGTAGAPEEVRERADAAIAGGDALAEYHRRLTRGSAKERAGAAAAWHRWGGALGGGLPRAAHRGTQRWDGATWAWEEATAAGGTSGAGAIAAAAVGRTTPGRAPQPGEGLDRGGGSTEGAVGCASAGAAAAAAAEAAAAAAALQRRPLAGDGGGVVGGAWPEADGAASTSEAQAILECHYSVNGGFLETPLLDLVPRIAAIPAVAVHGRADLLCPVKNAWDLHKVWPALEVRIVDGAAHSMYDPAIAHELLSAADRLLAALRLADDREAAVAVSAEA